jgi:hypothetical protein
MGRRQERKRLWNQWREENLSSGRTYKGFASAGEARFIFITPGLFRFRSRPHRSPPARWPPPGRAIRRDARSGLRHARLSPRPPKRLAIDPSTSSGWEAGRVVRTFQLIIRGAFPAPRRSLSRGRPVTPASALFWPVPKTGSSRRSRSGFSAPFRDGPFPLPRLAGFGDEPTPETAPACRGPSHAFTEPTRKAEVTAALPDTRCAPGSRKGDATDYRRGGKGVDEKMRMRGGSIL